MSNDVIASNISTIAALNAAIDAAANEGASATPYEIDLAAGADIGLSQALEAINLKSGVTLDIVGNGATLDGENKSTGASYNQRGLFVYSGVVNISDLTVANAKAIGGTGGSGDGAGGGGAGLGGGLFVAGATTSGGGSASGDPSQAVIPDVTITNVAFLNDSATGGVGGQGGSNRFWSTGAGGGGSGGMGGASGSGAKRSDKSRRAAAAT